MPGASPRGTGCTRATYSLSRSCEYPRVAVRQKTNISANRFALIIAFSFLYVMRQGSKFVSESRTNFLAASGLARMLVILIPEGVGQIHNDRFGSAADDDPLEGKIARRIDFLMGNPRRDIEEVARVQGGIELPPLAPPNIGRAVKHVRDGVLLTVMVDCRAGTGFNTKDATPHGRVYASLRMNGCETLRSGRLSGCRIELIGA